MMKNIVIVILVLLLGVGLYYLFSDSHQIDDALEKKEVLKMNEIAKKKETTILVKKEKSMEKKTSSDSDIKNELITDSRVIKLLIDSFDKRDRDAFEKVYNAQKMELRGNGDHSEFYQQFKNFFLDNNLSEVHQRAILGLLSNTGTKESIQLLFEMFDDGTVSNEEVQSRQSVYFLDSTRRILEDPMVQINKQELIEALKVEYRKTENEHLKGKAAKLIAWFDSTPQTQVMLFQDYMQEEDSAKKSAAKRGLMNLHGEALLPELHDNLRSNYQEVRQTAGMVLANMGTDKAVETLTEWTMEKATVENAEELKEWYGNIIQTNGIYKVTKNIEMGKIRDEELRGELERFFEEELEKEKNREVRE